MTQWCRGQQRRFLRGAQIKTTDSITAVQAAPCNEHNNILGVQP